MFFKDKSPDVIKATLLDVDALALPQIPFYLLAKKFGISNEQVAQVVIDHVESTEFNIYKKKKLEALSNSELYESYVKNYDKIEGAVKNAGKDPSKLNTEELMRLEFCYFGNIKYIGCDKYGKSFIERNVDGFPVGTEYPTGNSLPDRNGCLKLFPNTIIDLKNKKGKEYALLQRFAKTPPSLAR